VGEHSLADYLGEQAAIKLRFHRDADPAIIATLRKETVQRKRKIAEAQASDKASRDLLATKKVDLQIATEKRLAASADAKKTQALAKSKDVGAQAVHKAAVLKAKEKVAAAKALEEQAKEIKKKCKTDQISCEKANDQRRRTFAGKCAGALAEFMRSKKNGGSRREALLKWASELQGKVPWKKVAAMPHFWDPKDKRGLHIISPKKGFGDKSYLDNSPIYASETFCWEMANGKPIEGPALTQLRKFVEFTLPGYSSFV
jgi:hypothetical protein